MKFFGRNRNKLLIMDETIGKKQEKFGQKFWSEPNPETFLTEKFLIWVQYCADWNLGENIKVLEALMPFPQSKNDYIQY